jgi:predicted N-acetyltransferase YhbS
MTSMTSVQRALKSEGAQIASLHPLAKDAGLVVVREERAGDVGARESLLDAAFGAGRFAKTSEILRAGRVPARGLALVAMLNGEMVGTVRLWHIDAGGAPALLLGPLAVSGEHRALGIGGLLMREAIARARSQGHEAILLVGDEPYYRKFGFEPGLTRALDLPGPVDRARFLALELETGALKHARGMVHPTGAKAATLRAKLSQGRRAA